MTLSEQARVGQRLVPRSVRAQIVVATMLLMTAVMVLVGLGVHLALDITSGRDVDSRLDEQAASVVSTVQDASATRLRLPVDGLEPGVQVYDGTGLLIGGSIEREVRGTAAVLGRSEVPTTDDNDEEVRLHAVPFTTRSGEAGVVVVSQDKVPYERSELYAFVITVVLGVAVVGIAGAIAHLVTTQALTPVREMADRASEWSEHDLGQRFALGPPDTELAVLGETLDHLLDRVASAIRSEQRLTSELAHELRTPLTGIQGCADLALMRGVGDPDTRADLEQISTSAREMSVVISTLLDLAREGVPTADEFCSVATLAPSVRSMVPVEMAFIDALTASPARVAAPGELVLRSLSPLLANAVRHARTQVSVAVREQPDAVVIAVSDDGAGVDEEIRPVLFEPGRSGAGGTGLGLGIARRVARSLGGDVRLEAGASGTTFVLRLPPA